MDILEINNVSKKIRGKTILDNITFKVSEGDIFGFIGPNGAGKSTMIKTMLGLYKKNNGNILIGGIDTSKNFEESLKQVGAIIENPDMYSYLTGMQNLSVFANMRGGIPKDKIMEYVKLVKLENRINDKLRTYSLGMKQRLGLVQALMHNPRLLVLDEPTNGLDPLGIIELREILRKINKEYGTTIFISSHILSEIENICNVIAIIDNGKIIDIKTIEEIKKEQENQIFIEVDNIEKAREILAIYLNIDSVVKDNYVVIDIKHEDIPNVSRYLLNNNINVYQIKNNIKSLEEEFIEKTTGSKTQIK
jgi:ABC-2 type transport system ATP-binding protein